MRIEHLAIWVHDLEEVKEFYIKYFEMKCSEKYTNINKSFSSYFLSFEGASTRIEIMSQPAITELRGENSTSFGLTHFSISVGSKRKVDKLTEKLRFDGYKIVGETRTTGDGYYENVIEDCEGNWVEITE
ncbi:MAG: VOC family protein [Bacteroidales bacterium]|nr:VOC family protein [Bacteroidales bacterium]